MRRRLVTCLCLCVTLFFVVAGCAFGQVTTGTPPYSVSQGGPDKVDPANLNLHLTIPILSKAGRKISLVVPLGYDSSIWTPINHHWWYPDTDGPLSGGFGGNQIWGWTKGNNAIAGGLSFWWNELPCYDDVGDVVGETDYYNGFTYIDKNATPHAINANQSIIASGDPSWCENYDEPTSGSSLDGSGYYMYWDDAGSQYVITPSGTTITPPEMLLGYSWYGGFSIQDTNGNYLLSSGSVVHDTLSSTAAALTISGSGTSSSPETYTYTAPSGASATFTVKYTNYNIQTNFGCSGVTEYGASNVPLVSEIDLPDQATNTSDKYTFTYEPTVGWSGYYTGRIASVTLPTGGTISYSYNNGTYNEIDCGDGGVDSLTRTTPDGTWTYNRSSGATTITDPNGNNTVMDFLGVYPTAIYTYSGTSTLLKSTYICYNSTLSSCNSSFSLPITSKAQYIQWPGSGGLESETVTVYNTHGLVTEVDEYAYGAGSPGSLLRKTLTTYNTTLTNNILDKPSEIKIEDGSSAVMADTTYSYDGSSATATSGTPQHNSISGSRGNVTTVSTLVSGSTYLSKTFSYYDTGNIYQATDVNSAATTYNYSSASASCGNSFPTSISEPLSLSKSFTWNCVGGVRTSVTDENGNSSSSTYSSNAYYWVPDSETDALSDVASYTYTPNSTELAMPFNSGNSTVDELVTIDSLGRTHVSQAKEGPSSSILDSVETDYDDMGRPDRTTLPYSTTTAGGTSSTAPGTSTTYDPLGRKTGVTDSGGLSVSFSYTQNDALKTAGPAPTGENTKKKQYEFDAFGRLISVCEITSGAGSGTCGQTNSQTGFWTEYSYDVNNNLAGVTQNAQASSIYQQTRSYSHDNLGRLTSETNPESGTTNYVYDTDSTCGTYTGDLVKRTDNIGNITCYAYDSLHRMTSMTYPSGSYASVTPSRYYVYDSATVNSVSMSNAKMHLAEAYTCTSCPGTKITDLGFSYDARGQVNDTYESTPHSSGYYHVSAAYWANGVVKQLSNLSGLPTITYGVDSKGRGNTVTASSGQNPVTAVSYNVANRITGITFGSSDSDSFSYDPNTSRMTQYTFTVNGSSMTGALTWNDIGTLASLAVTDPFYSGGNQTCSFTHDDLIRISGVNCGSVWLQTFSFDPFGNIAKSGSGSFAPTYSYSTNHMTLIGSSTPSYDSDGNVTNDFLHTYAWDSNGRPVTIDGVGATYDALGRMIEQNRSSAYTEIVYAPAGGKLALVSGTTLQKAYVQLPDGAMAVYNSSGLAYYRHTDWIGSSRLASTPSRTIYFDGAYAPYGESYAANGTSDLSFTGMNQDTVSNLYDFPTREYGIQGRWPSPDPAGLSSVHLKDPQTLNRYAYARNNPLALVDPNGEDSCNDYGYDFADCYSFCPQCDDFNQGSGDGGGNNGGDVGTDENTDPGNDPTPPALPPPSVDGDTCAVTDCLASDGPPPPLEPPPPPPGTPYDSFVVGICGPAPCTEPSQPPVITPPTVPDDVINFFKVLGEPEDLLLVNVAAPVVMVGTGFTLTYQVGEALTGAACFSDPGGCIIAAVVAVPVVAAAEAVIAYGTYEYMKHWPYIP